MSWRKSWKNKRNEESRLLARTERSNEIICPHCGKKTPKGKFCMECGQPLISEEQEREKMKKEARKMLLRIAACLCSILLAAAGMVSADTVYDFETDHAAWTGKERVTVLSGKSTPDGSRLEWQAVAGADGYIICAIQNGSAYRQLGFTTGTSYLDMDASFTMYSYYWVFPFKKLNGKTVRGDVSSYYVYGIRQLEKPVGVKAAGQASSVRLSWQAVPGADGYVVKVKRGSGEVRELADVLSPGYSDTGASYGEMSYYWVYAYKKFGTVRRPGVTSTYVYGKTTEPAPHTDHTWVLESETESTCVKAGVITYACSNCGRKRTEEKPLAGHTSVLLSHRDATCNEEGADIYGCSVCGITLETRGIPKTEHDFVVTEIPDTNGKPGYKRYVCRICGHEEHRDLVDYENLYTYNARILNKYTVVETATFGTPPVIIFVETEDPSGTILSVRLDEYITMLGEQAFSDIHYISDEDGYVITTANGFRKVNGGYIYCAWFSEGHHTIAVNRTVNGIVKNFANFTVDVISEDAVTDTWLDRKFAELTNTSMSDREKLDVIFSYMNSHFKYYANNGQYLLNLFQETGALVETTVGDCIEFSNLMIRAAKKLGLSAELTYAGYANHHYATVTFKDGSTKIYDAPISAGTNVVHEWNMVIP